MKIQNLQKIITSIDIFLFILFVIIFNEYIASTKKIDIACAIAAFVVCFICNLRKKSELVSNIDQKWRFVFLIRIIAIILTISVILLLVDKNDSALIAFSVFGIILAFDISDMLNVRPVIEDR